MEFKKLAFGLLTITTMKHQAFFNTALSLSLLGLTALSAAAKEPVMGVPKTSQELQTAQYNSKLALNEEQNSCATKADYPLGRWEIGTSNATPAEYATFITFTKPKSGTWLPSSGQGSFTASKAPAPNRAVTLKLRPDGNSSYVSTNKLVTSSDGCYMRGTFNDTENHRGEVEYKWMEE
jgi:hypothetical protein